MKAQKLEKLQDIQQASRYFSYSEYKEMVVDLFADNKVTGPHQIPAFMDSTKMSIQRMKKWDKIYKLSDELKEKLDKVKDQWTWYVITEGWCGDAAQILPVIAKAAAYSGNIELKMLLRDENEDIMEKYLTNGGKAIPVLVMVNNTTGEEMPHWGPRPVSIIEKLGETKKESPDITKSELSKQLHLWYAKDKGMSTQHDILELVKQYMIPQKSLLHKVS